MPPSPSPPPTRRRRFIHHRVTTTRIAAGTTRRTVRLIRPSFATQDRDDTGAGRPQRGSFYWDPVSPSIKMVKSVTATRSICLRRCCIQALDPTIGAAPYRISKRNTCFLFSKNTYFKRGANQIKTNKKINLTALFLFVRHSNIQKVKTFFLL